MAVCDWFAIPHPNMEFGAEVSSLSSSSSSSSSDIDPNLRLPEPSRLERL